ncbi:MAG: hypothetical protein JWO15_2320 [Sphingomonadales bacterium]|nr:hypothetical protein [Sphingomonadales bacterium]
MKAQTMRSLRKYHHFIGVFFAPAIVLFSISGALQTFRLQQVSGYGSTPPAAFVWMASFHKDQELPTVEAPKPPPKPSSPAVKKPPHPPQPVPTLALKIFVVLLSIGLLVSTALGVIIALNNRATRRISIIMLVVGSVLPVALLYL